MPAKLLYRDAQGRVATVDVLESTPVFLGRGQDCAIRTEDAMVSRKNTRIFYANGRFHAEDLTSANGTYVNDRRVQTQVLAHDDIIRCGSLQIRFAEVAAAAVEQQPARPRTQEMQAAVVVDHAEMGGASGHQIETLSAERDQLRRQFDEQKGELEGLRTKFETAENELKRLRTEVVQSREELAKAKRDTATALQELHARERIVSELNNDVALLKDEAISAKKSLDEMTEELAARDRQLERAQEDVQRTKQTMEELRAKLAELQKTKDEGWNELNKQLAQVDNLREVISEQERILEERRVGLISLESAAKDLRAEKEKVLRELVDTKNARDDLRDKLNRAEAKVEGLEEEHRRLARAMNEGGASNAEEMSRLAEELRNLKVDFKKLETERQRAVETAERLEAERQQLSDARAKLDVERGQAVEDKKTAEASRVKAEEARAKAESAKQRAEEEKQQASAARDTALQTVEDLRRSLERGDKKILELQKAQTDAVELSRSLDKAERRVQELEEALATVTAGAAAAGGAAAAAAAAPVVDEESRARAARAEAQLADAMATRGHLEADIQRLGTEVSRLTEEARVLRDALAQAQARLAANPDDVTASHVPAALAEDVGAELKARAQEVYDGINSALSELRTTLITAKGLFGEVGPRIDDEDARKALGDAIGDSMERTEDAKGLLRSLKELAAS